MLRSFLALVAVSSTCIVAGSNTNTNNSPPASSELRSLNIPLTRRSNEPSHDANASDRIEWLRKQAENVRVRYSTASHSSKRRSLEERGKTATVSVGEQISDQAYYAAVNIGTPRTSALAALGGFFAS